MLGLMRSANKQAVLTMCGSVFSENRILTNMEISLKVTEREKVRAQKAMFMLGYTENFLTPFY